MAETVTRALNDGRLMPALGLGTYQIGDGEVAGAIRTAVQAGYRAIDTAAIYANERGVGEGVRSCGLPREALFVTSKMWRDDVGYDTGLRAFDASMARLGLDYLDLYLVHWPAPRRDRYVDGFRALIRLRAEGRVRSIGVSNHQPAYIERVIAETGVTPAVNQVELHPWWQQHGLREFHARAGIVTTSWSPLGQARNLGSPVLANIAAKHGKTPAQVVIAWHLALGLTTIPKSGNSSRIAENGAVFDFALDAEDLAAIAGLDSPTGRIGPDPANFN